MTLPKIKHRNHVVVALQKRQAGFGRHEKTLKAKRRHGNPPISNRP